jgi:putative N6-adenine-specific DNA methylase
MAEKHRFKKEREFKKRLDEQEENEGADIRNFKFHSLEKRNDRREERAERKEFRGERKDFRGDREKSDRSGRKERYGQKDRSGKKPFHKGDRQFGNKKNSRRFNDDED